MIRAAIAAATFSVVGCASMSMAEIGMDEKAWLRRTLVADLVGLDKTGERVWQSGSAFYHFRDGKLSRITRDNQHEVTVR
jgi:hypothetical protein